MKRTFKLGAIAVAENVGPLMPTAGLRRWFCNSLVPYLMDPAVLPSGLVARPTRNFGISVLCDPYIYVHRNGYWCGVFYEEDLEKYILREIALGDTVIDVGMNVGHVTIPASVLVGNHGKVISFEPNSHLVESVKVFGDAQGLKNITILPYGLGNTNGLFDLMMEPAHTGGATFRNAKTDATYSVALKCEVKVGDDVLCHQEFSGRVFLKLDVEGFEIQALEGLRETLPRIDHAVIEVSPEWLTSEDVAKLFRIMGESNMKGFQLHADGRIGSPVLPEEVKSQINVVFCRPPH